MRGRRVHLARRLGATAAVAALIAFATPWQLLAQTTGQQTTPGQTSAAPQAAPPGQPSSTTERRPAPAPQPPQPAQSPSTGGPQGATVQPSSFPIKLPPMVDWSFGGFFGTFDEQQLQRGYQVYKEVCSNCHSMNLVAFRNLADVGGPHFTADEVKALAASYRVADGPNEAGDMFQRPGRPSDYFQAPFANPQAAAASNGGAAPPDLSVIAKARAAGRGLLWAPIDFFTAYQEAGPDYINALLTGFATPPPGTQVPSGTYYNPYFLNGISLKMPPPLMDGLVKYSDGTPGTIEQYARDVSAFLMWAAEPRLVERKEIGFRVFVFLIIFAALMYATKRKVWATVPH